MTLILGLSGCICICSFWVSTILGLSFICMYSMMLLSRQFSMSSCLASSSSSISILLVFLSLALCILALICTSKVKEPKYILLIVILCLILVLTFSTNNIYTFYVMFEASLIPTLLLIVGWGYQPERLQAGSYMLLYTVAGSLPLLVLIINQSVLSASSSMWFLAFILTPGYSVLILVAFTAFLVKLPMYSLHLWLPKAHVEAPLAGSMILAGILLKLGGYGLFLMNKIFEFSGKSSTTLCIVTISLWGGLLSTLMCLRQTDIKSLIAYSSIGHMGIVIAGFLLDYSWGPASATMTMFAHGFTSSAMFCLAYYTYEKVGSRSMTYTSGILAIYPVLSLFWFVVCCVNMAAPPTLNLMGEMMIMPSLWSSHWILAFVMGVMVFFSASYNMFLYCSVNHGGSSKSIVPGKGMSSSQMSGIFLHLVPLLLLLKIEILI
uniref:NADH-ubiquinone oxidoreductase chain 4 n=1 Tax=Onchidella borealis TaxID=244421 RepID=E6Y1C9_9EUPU|nr:NADH dehydrogenase subunit 4 [Onchidella borealis]